MYSYIKNLVAEIFCVCQMLNFHLNVSWCSYFLVLTILMLLSYCQSAQGTFITNTRVKFHHFLWSGMNFKDYLWSVLSQLFKETCTK